jgi:hypothetical protein
MSDLNIKSEKTSGGVPVQTWQESVQLYSISTPVATQKNCFALMFTNVGDTIVRVNNMILFPNTNPATGLGDSRSIAAHRTDLYKGSINVSFDNPGGANPLVEIVQLCYHEQY